MKRRYWSIVLVVALWANPAPANEMKDFCQSYVGKNYFLKIDVVKVSRGLGKTDTAHIYSSGEVRYMHGATKSHDMETTLTGISRKFAAKGYSWELFLLRRGTEILIHSVQLKNTEVQIKFTQLSGREVEDLKLPKHAVKLRFDKGYTIDDVKNSFDIGFALTKEETVSQLRKGMTETEIIEIRGLPDTRVVLEAKTILIYGNLKLILVRGSLTDAI